MTPFEQEMVWQGQENLYIQAAIAIGALVVAVLAIWGDRLKDRLFGPRLAVAVHLKPPYCQTTSAGVWFRVEVSNQSRSVARDVELWIVDLNRVAQGHHISMGLVPAPLIWTHTDNPTASSVNPSFSRYCDFGVLENSPPHPVFRLSTWRQPIDQSNRLGSADYEIQIAITASNAKARYFVLRFDVPNYRPPTEEESLKAVNLRCVLG